MKEEISPRIHETQNNSLSSKSNNFREVELSTDSDNDSTCFRGSGKLLNEIEEAGEIQENMEITESSFNEINLDFKHLEIEKEDFETNYSKYFSGENLPKDFNKWSKNEQKDWLRNKFKVELPGLSANLNNLSVAWSFEGDCGRSTEEKPSWLDLEKFKRGQKFARDHFFGLSYAQFLSLFVLFSFHDGLKPLIITGKSSTPYTAFKRYLSTSIRVRNWHTEDPWTKGTAAYNDIQTVRKMHGNIRRRLDEMKNEDIDASAKIENPYCPTIDILLKDFQSTCPAPAPGQCPYLVFENPNLISLRPKGLHQGEMTSTQFGFIGLMILYPKSFGAHSATEEDLEAFCHTWRGIGYLLGMDDDFNLCRGSLNDVRQRCRDILELWVKPNFREITPEWEHMTRCIVEALQYYFPGTNYESSLLYLSELLNLHTPRLNSSLSYGTWIKHNLVKFFFSYTSRLPGLMMIMNEKLNAALDKAVNFSPEKHEELKKKSEETLLKGVNKIYSH